MTGISLLEIKDRFGESSFRFIRQSQAVKRQVIVGVEIQNPLKPLDGFFILAHIEVDATGPVEGDLRKRIKLQSFFGSCDCFILSPPRRKDEAILIKSDGVARVQLESTLELFLRSRPILVGRVFISQGSVGLGKRFVQLYRS